MSQGDKHEQEADEVARKVVSGENMNGVDRTSSGIQKKHDEEEDGTLMAKGEDGGLKGTDKLQANLDASKVGGQSLDDKTKSEMESKMGADLSDVKIHTGSNAHEMAEGIKAKAFTHGQDIYFKNGNYNTNSSEGKELLAHELAHTQQQKEGVERKVQRQAEDPKPPQEFADNYFSGIEGYSWTDLKKYLGSDGSKEQDNKLQKLLSTLIDFNKELTPAELWKQISIDPAALKGYSAFSLYTGDTNTLPKFNRAASTPVKEKDADAGTGELESGTIDYRARRHFIWGKAKKEEKRKAASGKATAFVQQTAAQIRSVTDDVNASKHQLESDLQNLSNDINKKLLDDAAAKESQTFQDITKIKENALTAKAEIKKYYYGSITVIDNNTKVQKGILNAYAQQSIGKLLGLQAGQDIEINKLYSDFDADVQSVADVKSAEAITAGGKRYNEIQANKSITNPLLKEGKQKAVIGESKKVSSEIQDLGTQTKENALGLGDQQSSDGFASYSQNEGNQFRLVAEANINLLLTSALDFLDQMAYENKATAEELRDSYEKKIDEQAIIIIDSLFLALQTYYSKLNDFGTAQDTAISALYSSSVSKLNAASSDLVLQSKTRLETFKASQTGLRTPRKRKLQKQMDKATAEITPLLTQASAGVQQAANSNSAELAALNTAVQTTFDQMSAQGIADLDTLMQSSTASMDDLKTKGVADQLQLRVDHLNKIISNVADSKKLIDSEVSSLKDRYAKQLAALDTDLQTRLNTFDQDAQKILDGLGQKMAQAEVQAETDLATGKLQRSKNVYNFEQAKMKLTGTEDCYKLYRDYLFELQNTAGTVGYGPAGAVWVPGPPGSADRADKNWEDLDLLAKRHGFAGARDYADTVEAFEKGFRQTVSVVAMDMVDIYEQKLNNMESDVRDPLKTKALFDRMAPYRATMSQLLAERDFVQSMSNTTEGAPSVDDEMNGKNRQRTAQENERYKAAPQKIKELESSKDIDLKPLYAEYPILDDKSFPDEERLSERDLAKVQDAEELKKVLLAYIETKRVKVKEAREHLVKEEGTTDVYNMTEVMNEVYTRFNIAPDSMYDQIVQKAIADKAELTMAIGIILSIVAIVLSAISLGAATPALVALGAGLGALSLDALFIVQAVNQYDRDKSLADVGLTEDPSMIWIIIAIVGTVIDAAFLSKALRRILPLAKELEVSGEVAKFNKGIQALEKDKVLTGQMSRAIQRAAEARTAFYEALAELKKPPPIGTPVMNGVFSDEMLVAIGKMANALFKEGVATFEQFALSVQRALNKAKFTPEEWDQLKKVWKEMQEGAEKGLLSAEEILNSPVFKKILETVPKKFKVKFQCDNYANSLKNLMKEENMVGEHIRILNNGPAGYIFSIKNGKIAESGFHEGIKVGDMMFDCLNPNGVKYSEWLVDLDFAALKADGTQRMVTLQW